jgi:hypothetical protein
MLKNLLAAAAIALPLAAPAQEVAKPPQTIALISTLGDQLSIVKQRGKRARSVDDFSRRTVQVDPQLLNMAVLRGLDSALAAEEPASRRIMLRWSANPGLAEQLKNASFEARDALVLDALRERLAQIPQRTDWDRIEASASTSSPPATSGSCSTRTASTARRSMPTPTEPRPTRAPASSRRTRPTWRPSSPSSA